MVIHFAVLSLVKLRTIIHHSIKILHLTLFQFTISHHPSIFLLEYYYILYILIIKSHIIFDMG